MKKHIFVCLLLALSGAACTENAPSSSSQTKPEKTIVVEISASEAAKLVAEDEITILDIRTPAEFQAGHIPDAILADYRSKDFQEIVSSLESRGPYLVHCASGGRSSQSLKTLRNLGWEKIYHLSGGFSEWEGSGLPVAK